MLTLFVAVLVAASLVVVACLVGDWLYNRTTGPSINVKSTREAALSVHLEVTAQRINPSAHRLTLSVLLDPVGRLAKKIDERTVFAHDTKLSLNSSGSSVTYRKDTAPTLRQVSVPLDSSNGSITDYPWDEYAADTEWTASVEDPASIPVELTFTNSDQSFRVASRTDSKDKDQDTAAFRVHINRSSSMMWLAWCMMFAMWALALAVVAGAITLVRKREGLTWPALGWMAATLFALVGFRSAAPGSPPIGSRLDYLAFFWAEALITLSIAGVVSFGSWVDHKAIAAGKTNKPSPYQCPWVGDAYSPPQN